MSRKMPTIEEMTKKVLSLCDRKLPEYTPENTRYNNPLPNARTGKKVNWDKSNGGFVPEDTVNTIRAHKSIPAGIKNVVDFSEKQFNEYSDIEVTDKEYIGIIEVIVGSFGLGALAERKVANELHRNGEDVKEPLAGDENNKIDIRTTDNLYQVKYAEKYRSDWNNPQNTVPGDSDKGRFIVWVKPSGKMVINRFKSKLGTKKYEEL